MAATLDVEKAPVFGITPELTEEEIEQLKQQDRLNALLKEHGVSLKQYISPVPI